MRKNLFFWLTCSSLGALLFFAPQQARTAPSVENERSVSILGLVERDDDYKRQPPRSKEKLFFLRIGEDPGLWMRNPERKEQIIGFCQKEEECKTFETIIKENRCRSPKMEWIQGIEQSFVVIYCQSS